MTSTPNTPPSDFPTEWHMIDAITKVECRQTSEDTYQLRSKTHIVTLNREGFDLYRHGPDAEFDKWLDENHIVSEKRDDLTEDTNHG